jgi:hypothetical protein
LRHHPDGRLADDQEEEHGHEIEGDGEAEAARRAGRPVSPHDDDGRGERGQARDEEDEAVREDEESASARTIGRDQREPRRCLEHVERREELQIRGGQGHPGGRTAHFA